MKKINITSYELEIMKQYPTNNEKLLRYMCEFFDCIDRVWEYLSPYQLLEYLQKQGLGEMYTYEYLDYLDACKKMGFDMKDKEVLFPQNLLDSHDKILLEFTLVTNPLLDDKIKNLSFFCNIKG